MPLAVRQRFAKSFELVADLLGVSVATVNRHARSGQLRADAQMPGSKGARLFHPSEVARFRSDMAAEAARLVGSSWNIE